MNSAYKSLYSSLVKTTSVPYTIKVKWSFLTIVCLFIGQAYAQQPITPKNIDPSHNNTPINRQIKRDTGSPIVYTPTSTALTASTALRQTLTVATDRIYPEWVAGDRDFAGHGPNVNIVVFISLSADGAQLEGLIEM